MKPLPRTGTNTRLPNSSQEYEVLTDTTLHLFGLPPLAIVYLYLSYTHLASPSRHRLPVPSEHPLSLVYAAFKPCKRTL